MKDQFQPLQPREFRYVDAEVKEKPSPWHDELQALKDHLRQNKENFVFHNSWCGDTEGGFYATDDFDMEKLCKEIDSFGESLRLRAKS